MYKIMMMISIAIRQFLLPNPFEGFGESAILINWIAGIVMAPLSYLIVGLVYEKGSEPAVGSFLYLMTYTLLTCVLWILGFFKFAWWWILIFMAVFIGVIIGIRIIGEKVEDNSFRN